MDILIETVKGSNEKFNYDSKRNRFYLKKLLPVGMVFPFDFGMIPHTKGEDGDELDAIVISEISSFPGCYIDCRLVGVLQLRQTEEGKKFRNDRYVFVPKASRDYQYLQGIEQLSAETKRQLEEFFIHYNRLEGKQIEIIGWVNASTASGSIQSS